MIRNYDQELQEMLRIRNMTERTETVYQSYQKRYLTYVAERLSKDPEEVSWSEMRGFIFYLENELHLADDTLNGYTAYLQFFTRYVLHREWDDTQLPKRKVYHTLPEVPSVRNVLIFIDGITDILVKAAVVLMFGSGLRICEACSIRCSDIYREENKILIRKTKNRHERYVAIPNEALSVLSEYWRRSGHPKTTVWLFPGAKPNQHISMNTVRNRMKAEINRMGIDPIRPHSLRHAFGSFMYRKNKDLLGLMKELGHRSISSTLVYVHLNPSDGDHHANPLEGMNLSK